MTYFMKTPLILALAAAASLPFASAQEERRPDNPPRPADAERPPGPRERRPDAERPLNPPADRRPDSDRDPGQRRPEAQRPGAPRPEGDLRDGFKLHADRPDGQRVEIEVQGEPGRDRQRFHVYSNPPRPQKPTAYLGVVTRQVEPALGAQLGLPEGFGLVVDEVVPDSPAARAGVQRFDVIKQLNDQRLTDPNQLAALVRSAGKDADVSLTVVRKGAEQKLSVKVGERMLSERRPLDGLNSLPRNLPAVRERIERSARDVQERSGKLSNEFGEKTKEYHERMREYGTRLREFQERAAKEPRHPDAKPPQPPEMPQPPTPPRIDLRLDAPPADVLKEVRPGGAAGVRVEKDGNVTLWNTANARAVVKDEEGEVVLSSDNGKRTVTARDRDGKEIFNGPIDTDEQRAALPESVRRKLEGMHAKSRAQGGASTSGAAASLELEAAPPPPADEREIQ